MKKISTFFLFVGISICTNAQIVKMKTDSVPQPMVVRQDISEKATSAPQPKSVATNKEVKVEKSTNKSTTISIRAGESQVTHDNTYYQSEIDKINSQISDINTKINSVNNDSSEKAIAIESGWFDDMERIKLELEARKGEFQNKLNN